MKSCAFGDVELTRRGSTPSRYHGDVDLWLRRATSFDEESEADSEFWLTMTPDERVAVLEQMRQEWIEEHGGDEGLRRTVRRLPQ